MQSRRASRTSPNRSYAKLVAERQRTRQVIAQLRLGEVRLALRDCIHDRLMIPHDLSGLAADGKVQSADAIDVTAAFAHERPEVRHTSGIVQNLVKCQVCIVEALEVARFRPLALLLDDGMESIDQAGISGVGQDPHRLLLDRATEELCLACEGYIDQAYDRPALRKYLDQPRLFEPHQCVPDRRRTQPEFPSQRRARQGCPWRQRERHDHMSQLLEDP